MLIIWGYFPSLFLFLFLFFSFLQWVSMIGPSQKKLKLWKLPPQRSIHSKHKNKIGLNTQ
jgi:hypothetical protein